MDQPASQDRANIDLGALLAREHAHLDRQFRDLLEAFAAGTQSEVARLWNQFDTDLHAHLSFEEEHLLPRFLDFNAPEALALLREHHSIRDRLLALGVGVDLHLTRQDQVETFLRELRVHAKREEALLYAWAATHVDRAELEAMTNPQPAA